MVGELIDGSELTWSVEKKTSARVSNTVEEAEYGRNNISDFCIKPYLVPVSGRKVKLTILAFPMGVDQLKTKHPMSSKAPFPGLELWSTVVNLFPATNTDLGKDWGSPITPLFLLGGDEAEHPNIPPTSDIKKKMASIFRTATKS